MVGYSYSGRKMTGDKEVRFGPISTQTRAGNIVLLRGDWNETLIAELISILAQSMTTKRTR